jgi:hypothetical protein
MDELFEIQPAFRAHNIMVQRMEEVEHEGSRYAEEKSNIEERVESVWGIPARRPLSYKIVRSDLPSWQAQYNNITMEKDIIRVQKFCRYHIIKILTVTSHLALQLSVPATLSGPLNFNASTRFIHAFQGKGPLG